MSLIRKETPSSFEKTGYFSKQAEKLARRAMEKAEKYAEKKLGKETVEDIKKKVKDSIQKKDVSKASETLRM